MPDAPRSPYQYAIVRVIPRVERGECLNVGVILLCRPRRFIGRPDGPRSRPAWRRSRRTWTRPRSQPHLEAIEAIASGDPSGGPIAALGHAERFHWLVAPASTIIQPSPVHTGLTDDPAAELERLVDALVR